MIGTYRVTLDNINVGTATVTQQGLYYHIVCNCTFRERGFYFICVQSGTNLENLGLCVPEGDHFKLEKKVPAKRFLENSLLFFATRKGERDTPTSIPIETGGEFPYLSDLTKGTFQNLKGKCSVVFPSKVAVQ